VKFRVANLFRAKINAVSPPKLTSSKRMLDPPAGFDVGHWALAKLALEQNQLDFKIAESNEFI
jgi:hypothetical protein